MAPLASRLLLTVVSLFVIAQLPHKVLVVGGWVYKITRGVAGSEVLFYYSYSLVSLNAV